MQQVKLFTGLEGQTELLAQEINDWIRESGANILQITGNIAPQSVGTPSTTIGAGLPNGRPPSDLFVIVLYEG